MRQILTSLVLISMLVAGFGPAPGMAEEPLEQGGHIEAITPPSGFSTFTAVSGLTDPRGVVAFPPLDGFPSGYYVVEKSLNRISFAPQRGTPTLFASVPAPTDLMAPPGGGGPFGNFLYAIDTTNNAIVTIDNNHAVQTFVSFTSTPARMTFSPSVGAFGTFLFVTLADGRLVKIAPPPDKTVTTCVSGLSGPTGLVFGPGGGFFKTTLFVVESVANRISTVTACPGPVTPFPTGGLTAPGALSISPGGGWGSPDTLYVVNGSSQVVTVDKTGTVTPFATGFTKADTAILAPWGFVPGNRLWADAALRVSDATEGTIEEVNVRGPFATTKLVGCDPCHKGDGFALSITVSNPSPMDVTVEIKAGFRFPDGTPVNFALSPINNNKYFTTTLPKGFSFSGPWVAFTVPGPAIVPPGTYCYQIGFNDPELYTFNANGISNNQTCFAVLP